jgi:hypothetical protein
VVDGWAGFAVMWFGADFALVEEGLGWWYDGRGCSGHLERDAWEGESGSQFEDGEREKMLFLHLLLVDESLDACAEKRAKKFSPILHK